MTSDIFIPESANGCLNTRTPEPPIIKIVAEDGTELLRIEPDGTVTGTIERSGEAAEAFINALRLQLKGGF